MAQDMFIKLAGIDGESQDSVHNNEIDVLQWQWSIVQESTMHTGSGGGTGKAQVGDLMFEHYVDRATPNLFKYCVTGKHIPEAKLTVRKAGGSPLEYMKITMTDVLSPWCSRRAVRLTRSRFASGWACHLQRSRPSTPFRTSRADRVARSLRAMTFRRTKRLDIRSVAKTAHGGHSASGKALLFARRLLVTAPKDCNQK